MDFATWIAGTRLFGGVEGPALGALVAMAKSRSFKKGEVICRQDELKPGIYIVTRGACRALILAEDGGEHVTRLVAPGEAFADMATLGHFPCPATVEATEATQTIFLPSAELEAWLLAHPAACRLVLARTAQEAGRFIRQLGRLTLLSAQSRVAQFLLERNGDVRWGKRHVASYLGLTSETFSRVLKRLADSGLIEVRPDGKIGVLDASGLTKVSSGQLDEKAVA